MPQRASAGRLKDFKRKQSQHQTSKCANVYRYDLSINLIEYDKDHLDSC